MAGIVGDISSITLIDGSAYGIKDGIARTSYAEMSAILSSIPNSYAQLSDVSRVYVKDPSISEYQDGKQSDLSILNVTNEEYAALLQDDAAMPNAIYVISDDFSNAYGAQLKNLAVGTDLSDAVTLQQLNDASNAISSGLSSKLEYTDISASYSNQHIYLSAKGHVVGDIDCSGFGGGGSAELSSLSCLEEILSAINGGNMPMAGVNLLPYTTVSSDNGTFLLNLATNTYRMSADMDSTDAIIPTPDSSLVPQSCQYYYFEMEVAIDSTATSLVSPTGSWIWISSGELPSSGYAGHTLYISVRFDCFTRTYLANAWRVA